MKTIKQIADDLGVSKQAVSKQLPRLPPTTVTTNEKGVKLIDTSGEAILKTLISPKSPTKPPTTPPTDKEFTNKLIAILESELANKNQQLEVKDEQIKELNARLAEAHAIINSEQLLHGGTLQKQLHSSDNETQPPHVDGQDSEELDVTVIRHENKQKKRGFFGLFNRNS